MIPVSVLLIVIICLLDGIQTDIRHLKWTVEEQTERKEHDADRMDNQS